MATVSIYLNFDGKTEEAFAFYKQVFGTEYLGDGVAYMGDVPPQPGVPELTEEEKKRVMHVALPMLGGINLMGTDIMPSMGHTLAMGDNVAINLEPDTRVEADRLFAALSEGGESEMEMQEMFWGDYFGSFRDKFGVRWMINTSAKE